MPLVQERSVQNCLELNNIYYWTLLLSGRCSECYGPGEKEYLPINEFQKRSCTPKMTYGNALLSCTSAVGKLSDVFIWLFTVFQSSW